MTLSVSVPEAGAPDPPLADDRILLRVPHPDDVLVIAAACRDAEIARWITSVPLNYTEEHALGFRLGLIGCNSQSPWGTSD
jgi:RimJ/RimL family protein N-acetyltransferase